MGATAIWDKYQFKLFISIGQWCSRCASFRDDTSMVSSLPAKAIDKVFGNKYDEKTGEMTQKRWGGVADEREVDPWILNFIKDPLGRKKVTENVEKIKRLLK
mgnify:CR=1 FL=1